MCFRVVYLNYVFLLFAEGRSWKGTKLAMNNSHRLVALRLVIHVTLARRARIKIHFFTMTTRLLELLRYILSMFLYFYNITL